MMEKARSVDAQVTLEGEIKLLNLVMQTDDEVDVLWAQVPVKIAGQIARVILTIEVECAIGASLFHAQVQALQLQIHLAQPQSAGVVVRLTSYIDFLSLGNYTIYTMGLW